MASGTKSRKRSTTAAKKPRRNTRRTTGRLKMTETKTAEAQGSTVGEQAAPQAVASPGPQEGRGPNVQNLNRPFNAGSVLQEQLRESVRRLGRGLGLSEATINEAMSRSRVLSGLASLSGLSGQPQPSVHMQEITGEQLSRLLSGESPASVLTSGPANPGQAADMPRQVRAIDLCTGDAFVFNGTTYAAMSVIKWNGDSSVYVTCIRPNQPMMIYILRIFPTTRITVKSKERDVQKVLLAQDPATITRQEIAEWEELERNGGL